MSVEVGVIALQGDVPQHSAAVKRAFDEVIVHEIRETGIVPSCELVVLPGGESTTISHLLQTTGIAREITEHVEAGKAMLATCAGLIVSATQVDDDRIDTLDLLDITVERNAYGRQRDSFEAPLSFEEFADPFPGVFIRAPRITAVGDCEILAHHGDEPVAVRSGSVIGASFHPELTDDTRLLELTRATGK